MNLQWCLWIEFMTTSLDWTYKVIGLNKWWHHWIKLVMTSLEWTYDDVIGMNLWWCHWNELTIMSMDWTPNDVIGLIKTNDILASCPYWLFQWRHWLILTINALTYLNWWCCGLSWIYDVIGLYRLNWNWQCPVSLMQQCQGLLLTWLVYGKTTSGACALIHFTEVIHIFS